MRQVQTLRCFHPASLTMVFPTFAAWSATFGKTYNGDEAAVRETIYNGNLATYTAHNADETQTYTMGPNQFTDLTLEEYQGLNLFGYKKPKTDLPYLGVHEYAGEELAASIDWRTSGAVTPVKDQGQCGSCWAFSTIGGLEGAWELSSGSLTSMSEQQLVDCSSENNGCGGGLMESAFKFLETQDVATESSYPYTADDENTCTTSGFDIAIPKGGVTGYKSVGQSSNALMSALQQGPVSVAIEADQSAFQGYAGGIISGGCGTSLDHGVTAVGYGTGYFIVKNSWGAKRRLSGYVKISTSGNTCGIHSDASYPTVQSAVQV